MGKLQLDALKFAVSYRGWHTYRKDSITRRTITSLVKRDLVECNEYNQFRATAKGCEVGRGYGWPIDN